MVKKETKLCIIKTIINSISNIIIAEFRRKKRNTLFPAATHLPKRCYGHLQPLQPTFVPVAVIISIRYYHVVKKPDIHNSSRFQQGMCQTVVVLTWLKIT